MPRNNDGVEQGDSTMLPEEDINDQESFEPAPLPVPAPEPVPSSKWSWIGSPDRPEAQEKSDGISDLFTVSAEDVGASDEDLSDLTDVDIDKDVLDADEDGSLDDLTEVTEADIMGDDDYGQRPAKPLSRQPKARRRTIPRYQPPTSMSGLGG